jgi:hypothetical protein
MGYQVYEVGQRWGGYGVPSYCEYPVCNEEIDRGMSYACGGEPFSEYGCDRYFCSRHLYFTGFYDGEVCKHDQDIDGGCVCECVEVCERCSRGEEAFPYKPEHPDWVNHLLKDKSWARWRKENPGKVAEFKVLISPKDGAKPREVV